MGRVIAWVIAVVAFLGNVLTGSTLVDGLLAGGFVLFVFWGAGQLLQRAKRTPARKRSRHIPQDVKIAVSQRDGGSCRKCNSTEDLQFDHVVPFSWGGSSTDPANIQLLCGPCNRRKSNHYAG